LSTDGLHFKPRRADIGAPIRRSVASVDAKADGTGDGIPNRPGRRRSKAKDTTGNIPQFDLTQCLNPRLA
jgi:hypothetical protein